MNNNYFESLKTDVYTDYLTEKPHKKDVLKNSRIDGVTAILPDSNNRALIIKTGDFIYLQSYDTLVLSVNPKTGDIRKLWQGYSQTTLKHVNTFLASFNGQHFNKKTWLAF